MALPPSSEVDQIIGQARQTIARVQAPPLTARAARGRCHSQRAARFILYAGIGIGGLMLMSIIWGLIVPLGFAGVMLLALALVGVVLLAGVMSREAAVEPARLAQVPLPQLADKADRWLAQQRAALPAPAKTLSDMIGERLAALAPQLDTIDAQAPEAAELRRLVSEDLPDLIDSYRRVPANMRKVDRNGRVAEQELVAGMKLVDQQIDEIAHTLAATEMDRLSSQKRYLELRYQTGAEPQ